MAWTPDTVEQLKVLWSQGLSITQIGKQLGMTRNAVYVARSTIMKRLRHELGEPDE